MEYLISGISLPAESYGSGDIRVQIAKRLRLPEEYAGRLNIVRRSIDARKKSDVRVIYQVSLAGADGARRGNGKNEGAAIRGLHIPSKYAVKPYEPVRYPFENVCAVNTPPADGERPVVIGAGPAGLFAAYLMAEAGLRPIVIERGKPVDERRRDVERLWNEGVRTADSDAAFGEGGAGAFSDGKLSTGNHDRDGRIAYILRIFAQYGADESILYDQKPHIGTDVLVKILPRIREHITALGGEYRFETKAVGLNVKDGRLTGIRLAGGDTIDCHEAVLAIGHSARDTYEALFGMGLSMEAKSFAVGLRVEHPQSLINAAHYGEAAKYLPAASYKLVTHIGERNVFSFCMCPGGYVVDSSTEDGGLVVNGMSYSGRGGANANSAIVVSVSPSDFGSESPHNAIEFQRGLEQKAFRLGGGAIPQQLYGDFIANRVSRSYGSFPSAYKGRAELCDMGGLFASDIRDAFIGAMGEFDRKISGFAAHDTILSGAESRTSAPIRIPRDEGCESEVRGLYPCGEGAGYAGGITSAAADGLRVAEHIIRKRTDK